MGHLHLILNHFPIVGLFFCLGALAYGLARNSDDVKVLSLWMFVAVALVTVPVFITGRFAEELVEHASGVIERMIEDHEKSAIFSLIAIEITGVLSTVALFLFGKSRVLNHKLVMGVLGVSLISIALVGYTANLGGQIRHTEIRPGYTPPPHLPHGSAHGHEHGDEHGDEHEHGSEHGEEAEGKR